MSEEELDPLLEASDGSTIELSHFDDVSVHAPAERVRFSEGELAERLRKVADRGWAVVVHSDVIEDFSLWRRLGEAVCIDNMDKRKKTGRTAAQLKHVFDELPEATLCFDIGHARQVDPTMQEAETILRNFHDRLRQVQMSHANTRSRRGRLNFESIRSFRRVAPWLTGEAPIILETPVGSDDVEDEILSSEKVFSELSCRLSPDSGT